MKENAKILLITSGILMILSFYLNFNDFIMGSTPKVVSFCSSILFFAGCCCLSFMKKSKKLSVALAIYTGFIAIVSLAAFIVGTYRSSADFLIPFVLIAMPPFYGLSLFCNISTSCLIIFVLGTLLFIVNVYFWKKKKGPGE